MSRIHDFGLEARQAWETGDTIRAVDCHKESVERLSAVLANLNRDIDPAYKRILKGNFHSARLSYSSAMQRHMVELHRTGVDIRPLATDFVKLAIESIDFARDAFRDNPEWTGYIQGIENAQHNLVKFLTDFPDVRSRVRREFQPPR